MKRPKLVHLISSTSTGGAESMLFRLLTGPARSEFEMSVISLTGEGAIGKKILREGIPLSTLGASRGRVEIDPLLRLAARLRNERPALLQTWMYHSDLAGGIAARMAGRIPVIWNIRHSSLDRSRNRRTTILTARLCARLSRALPARIVCCSRTSMNVHGDMGYDRERMVVIPNGFDTVEFSPDRRAGRGLRERLGIPDDAQVVGTAGRFHPDKDHATFFRAAGILRRKRPGTRFVLCGESVDRSNGEIVSLASKAGVLEATSLLGLHEDMPEFYSALDIFASSSRVEGFPNVLGEAMSCSLPCVVTDAGDSAWIVGGSGLVTPPGDPDAMALRWDEMLSLTGRKREELGAAARRRVEEEFSIGSISAVYSGLWRSIARTCGRRDR